MNAARTTDLVVERVDTGSVYGVGNSNGTIYVPPRDEFHSVALRMLQDYTAVPPVPPPFEDSALSPNVSVRRGSGKKKKVKKKSRKMPGLSLQLGEGESNASSPTKRFGGLKIDVSPGSSLAQSFSVENGAFQKGDVEISSKGVARLGKQESFEGVQFEDLEILGTLGRGASSYVNKAKHKVTGEFMAVKKIAIHSKGMRAQIMSEVKTLFDAKCPCLIKLLGVYFKEGSISIALEYMNEGCLDTAMSKRGPFPEDVLAGITYQTLFGLAYLHHEKRVHRDVKPQNILCNRKGEVKVTDFGISRELESTVGMCMTFVGTFKYMSPERIESKPYNHASDVWSLGIVLVECATGAYPYPHCSGHIEMVQTVLESPVPSIDDDLFSPEFKEFVACCLKKNPRERVPAAMLLHSPWLKKFGAISVKASRRLVKPWLKKTASKKKKQSGASG